MAKRYNIIMIISFLVFHIIFLAYAHSGFASRENEIIVKTYSILKAIGCAIKERWDHFPGSLPYPGNTDFCVDFIEAGKPCWNSPSIVGSTRPMLEYLNIGSEPSAELDNFVKEHMGNDNRSVAFRCRYDGKTSGSPETLCFAYYCENPSNQGCKQIWRIDWKINTRMYVNTYQFKPVILQGQMDEGVWPGILNGASTDPGNYEPICD